MVEEEGVVVVVEAAEEAVEVEGEEEEAEEEADAGWSFFKSWVDARRRSRCTTHTDTRTSTPCTIHHTPYTIHHTPYSEA